MVQYVPGVSFHCLETARKHVGCQLRNGGLLAKAVFSPADKHKRSSPCSAPIRIDGQLITSCHWGTAGQELGHSLLWSPVCLNHLWISVPASLCLLAIPIFPSGCQLTLSPPYLKLLGEGNGTPLKYSCLENPMDGGAWWAAVHGVSKSRTRLSNFTFTFQFHALEKEMATHSSVLAWRIPGTGEPGGLPSMGSHRVRHDWSDLAAAAAAVTLLWMGS